MAYITDAAREYAKKNAKDSTDLDPRIIEFEKDEIINRINNFEFDDFDKEDWYILGPAQDEDAFVTFDKKDEQFVKYILQKYGSMIDHIEDDVYLEVFGPNNKIKSEDGILWLEKHNILRPIQKERAEKYMKEFIEKYGE